MVGTHTKATRRKKIERACYPLFENITACWPSSNLPPFKNMPIIMVMTEGAAFSLFVKSVSHLQMIIKSMYPNNTSNRII